jgi:nucleoid DNA-binding protein
MNKEELIRAIHQMHNAKYTLKDLSEIFDAMLDVISDALARGEEVQLADFGTFALERHAVKSAAKYVAKKK